MPASRDFRFRCGTAFEFAPHFWEDNGMTGSRPAKVYCAATRQGTARVA